MLFSNWFNTDEVDEFARSLAQDLAGRLPLPATANGKKLPPERLNNTREAVQVRASAFARKQRVNWYKKAHLINTFKWALREAGYNDKFVDSWTYDLVIAMTPEKSKP